MESLDYFDKNQVYLGTASREEVHAKGYWHRTFHCWILQKLDSKPYILFQKRCARKKNFPNLYDITAAGHVLAGESLQEGSRELSEELGIPFSFDELLFIGIWRHALVLAQEINREFCFTYFFENEIPLIQYQLQAEEVEGIIRVELHDALTLIKGQSPSIQVEGVHLDAKGQLEATQSVIYKEDLLPHPNTYYETIFHQALRYFEGKKPALPSHLS